MKFSDILYEHAEDLWEEAAEKPFVVEMAEGNLSPDRFRFYMLQDYLYLQDYVDILKSIQSYTNEPSLRAFLDRIIEGTEQETYRVHVPNMRKIGVSDEDIRNAERTGVIAEYIEYMREQLRDSGLLAGLTALLQCSWIYAYIGRKVTEKYSEQLKDSPYRSWFIAYTCPEYVEANQIWIDVLDRETEGIGQEERDELCRIFRQCAIYENQFWDALHSNNQLPGETYMTNYERMVKGLIYDPADEEIMREQSIYQRKVWEFNRLSPSEQDKKQQYMHDVFAECGENCYIELPLHANWGGRHLHLGSGVYVNFHLTLVDDGHVYVGDKVMFGPNVTVTTANHPIAPELRSKGLQYNKDVYIGENAWLGAGVLILPGVKIGKNSVIGAGSIVTKDIPDNVVAVGNPCRVLREISSRDRKYFYRDEPIDWEELEGLI